MKKLFASVIMLVLMLTLVLPMAPCAYADGPCKILLEYEVPEHQAEARVFMSWKIFSVIKDENDQTYYYVSSTDTLNYYPQAFAIISDYLEQTSVTIDGSEYNCLTFRSDVSEDDFFTALLSTYEYLDNHSMYPNYPERKRSEPNGKEISDLYPGYYMVFDSHGKMPITLTLYDTATVVPKNEYITLNLLPDDLQSADVGSTVYFTAELRVPVTVASNSYVDVTFETEYFDSLGYAGGRNPGEGYYPIIQHRIHTNVFNVYFYSLNFEDLVTRYEGNEFDGKEYKILIPLQATMPASYTVERVDYPVHEIHLTASAKLMDMDRKVLYQTVNDSSTIYTYYIDVFKYMLDESGEEHGLAGADFILSKQVLLEEGQNPVDRFLKLNDGVISWVEREEATSFSSDENGSVSPIGGIASGQYTLREIKAPEGYNIAPDESIQIIDADVSVKVENKTSTLMPTTGSEGAKLFYLTGGLLMLLSLVFLMARRRVGEDI